MRTNTTTFRSRIIADFRTQGLTVAKAKAAAKLIVITLANHGFPDLANSAKACISFDNTSEQSVYMDVEGVARFHTMVPASLQPLVNTEATAEQQAISDEMVDMLSELYDAEGEEKARLNAIYQAKRDQILAINPFVHGGIADPDLFEFYHNVHKSEYGFRPRGFLTHKAMKEEVDRLVRTANDRTDEDWNEAA